MKIVRFRCGQEEKYGVLEGGEVNGLKGSPFSAGRSREDGYDPDGSRYRLKEVKLLTPCKPTKYLGVGLNFAGAAKAMGRPVPEYPITFMKPTGACIAAGEAIEIPVFDGYDCLYEGEMAVVIGKTARHVSREEALSCVFGYTCSNDITDRSQFGVDDLRLKAADTFGPIGPCIETELDPFDTRIRSWVNGQLRQDGNTKEMIFSVPYMISFFSDYMTLYPGDIISMGTPYGAGQIHPGDVLRIEVEGIGILENYVIERRGNKNGY